MQEKLQLNDELKKVGLRVRRRTVTPAGSQDHTHPQFARSAVAPGRIDFDEQGNATYVWSDEILCQDGADADLARQLALHDPRLSIVEEAPATNAPIRSNPTGLHVGYDPYESGLLAKKRRQKKRNLRELSQWMEMKRRIGQTPKD